MNSTVGSVRSKGCVGVSEGKREGCEGKKEGYAWPHFSPHTHNTPGSRSFHSLYIYVAIMFFQRRIFMKEESGVGGRGWLRKKKRRKRRRRRRRRKRRKHGKYD